MIKVENVSFKYKNSDYKVLNDLSFEINDGEIVAIVGENGSGKSTIGKLISGITKIREGRIIIDNVDISKKNKFVQDKVGIVFQNPENQIIFNNIYDELSFSLKDLDKNEIEERIDTSLKQVNMYEFKNSDLYSLSLGQKQRIMIAEVLAKKSKYIIFDEPTTMIDSKGKEDIYKIIKNLKKEGYTIICITNLADEILLADRTLILSDGKIVYEIEKKNLINSSEILNKYQIKEPTLLKVLTCLKQNGIILNLEEFSVEELVKAMKGIINEKYN